MTDIKSYNLQSIIVPSVFGVIIIGLSIYFHHKISEVNSKTDELIQIISNQQKILIKHEDAIDLIVNNISNEHKSQTNQTQSQTNQTQQSQQYKAKQPPVVIITAPKNLDDEIKKELEELDSEELICEDGICKLEKIEEIEEEEEVKEEYNSNIVKALEEEIKELEKEEEEQLYLENKIF